MSNIILLVLPGCGLLNPGSALKILHCCGVYLVGSVKTFTCYLSVITDILCIFFVKNAGCGVWRKYYLKLKVNCFQQQMANQNAEYSYIFSNRCGCRAKKAKCSNYVEVFPLLFYGGFQTRQHRSKQVSFNYGGLKVCDAVSVWDLGPLWSMLPLFTFNPDTLHKMEPKHQTETIEEISLLSRLCLFIHATVLKPPISAYLSQHSTIKKETAPPSSIVSMSLLVTETTVSCCPFINLPLYSPVYLCLWLIRVYDTTLLTEIIFHFHQTFIWSVTGVCALGLGPSTATSLWPSIHSLVTYQVAIGAVNTCNQRNADTDSQTDKEGKSVNRRIFAFVRQMRLE